MAETEAGSPIPTTDPREGLTRPKSPFCPILLDSPVHSFETAGLQQTPGVSPSFKHCAKGDNTTEDKGTKILPCGFPQSERVSVGSKNFVSPTNFVIWHLFAFLCSLSTSPFQFHAPFCPELEHRKTPPIGPWATSALSLGPAHPLCPTPTPHRPSPPLDHTRSLVPASWPSPPLPSASPVSCTCTSASSKKGATTVS